MALWVKLRDKCCVRLTGLQYVEYDAQYSVDQIMGIRRVRLCG